MDIDVPTDVDVDVVVADAVYEGNLIAKDRGYTWHDFETPVPIRSRSSQVTGAADVVGRRNLDMVQKFSETLPNVAT